GCPRAIVLHDEFDLAAAERVALGCQIELHAVLDLLAVRSERPRHRQYQADLDGVGRQRAACQNGSQGHAGQLLFQIHSFVSVMVEEGSTLGTFTLSVASPMTAPDRLNPMPSITVGTHLNPE